MVLSSRQPLLHMGRANVAEHRDVCERPPADRFCDDPWTAAMRRGDFEQAWRVCDDVLETRRGRDCSHWPRHLQYVWKGEPLDGRRVLVRCYHGLGDTIQFVRFLAPLRERARHVTLWAQPSLLALLEGSCGVDELLPLHDGAPQCDHDADVELMELPHVLRIRPCDLPGPTPYLACGAPREVRPNGDRVRVGLAWRGGDWNSERSIPTGALQALAQLRGVRWFSLQYPCESPPFPMTDLACQDIGALASRMQMLDLVISIDTMTAHLAGALGLPTWTLLMDECDWRWMRDRTDTPWYPTMRLFRQQRQGDWRAVIAEVAAALGGAAKRLAVHG